MDEQDFNSDAFNTPASDNSSDFPQTIDEAAATIATQMAPFTVTDTKINDMPDDTGLDSATSTQDNSSDFGSAVGDFVDSIVGTATAAAKDVAKAAIDKAKQSATSSLGGKGGGSTSTSKTTTTSTTKNTVLGMSPTTALVAAIGVGLLVYFASRSRSAVA